ncbi:MAG: lytic transglycosylase domain-containing protein [Deltaproteobacteria bacterium]|nr:lytic transglycosylase domain-containing protein [Deltaproteobacteria bacterium]
MTKILFDQSLPILKPVRVEAQMLANKRSEPSRLDATSRAYLDRVLALTNVCPRMKHDFDGFMIGYNIVRAVEEASEINGVSQDLLLAVIAAESRCNANAVSRAGAMGLMQITPRTARSLGIEQLFSIQQNIFGGAKYLARLLDKYNGDVRLALAAYNSGPGIVKRYQGLPPYSETSKYVGKVMAFRTRFGQIKRS